MLALSLISDHYILVEKLPGKFGLHSLEVRRLAKGKGLRAVRGHRQGWEHRYWESDGRKLISGWNSPKKPGIDRLTDTCTVCQKTSQWPSPREAEKLSSERQTDRPTDRQTETHSRKLQTRQTGQFGITGNRDRQHLDQHGSKSLPHTVGSTYRSFHEPTFKKTSHFPSSLP